MTNLSSISNLSLSTSPRTQMNARISAAVSAGSISAADQTALSSALDNIDAALEPSSSTTTQGSGGSVKGKIDSLIDKQVKAGTLTDDQATELKTFFAEGGPSKAHGAHGAGGPPPSSDPSSSDDSSSTSSTDTATQQIDAVISMLDKLRTSLTKNDATYGSTSSTSTASSGLVFSGVA